MRGNMNSPDFSVEEEIDKVLEILEKACERFGVGSPGPKKAGKPVEKGGGNSVYK
jgi:hypothetical protein